MARIGTIPVSMIEPAAGTISGQPAGVVVETPPEQWTYGAQADFLLPGIETDTRRVTVKVRVESGVLGAGWLNAQQTDWVVRACTEAAEAVSELHLPIPAGTRGGKLVFDNWTEGGQPARALISAITISGTGLDMDGLGITPDRVEFQSASELVDRGMTGVEQIELFRGGCGNPFRTYFAEDAVIIGRPGVFGIIRDGRFICLHESVNHTSLVGSQFDAALAAVSNGDPVGRSFGSACLLDGHFATNVWHWLSEWVPRVVALEEAGFTGAYLIPDGGSLFATSLKMIGINQDRLVRHTADYVRVERLALTQQARGYEVFGAYPWILHWLRERIRPRLDPPAGARRLYVARRGRRRVVNEDEVAEILQSFGFARVYMEDYPIQQQIAMAAHAEILAGPHGAGLVFALFMRRGGALIEMFPAEYVNPAMLGVCNALDLNYYMLTTKKFTEAFFEGSVFDADVTVDPNLLRLTLRNAIRGLAPGG